MREQSVGGVWLGAEYLPFENCIWTAGTRQAGAGEGARGEGARTPGIGAAGTPPESGGGALSGRLRKGKQAALASDGDTPFRRAEYTTDEHGRTVAVHGPTTAAATSEGGGEVWPLLQRLGCEGEPIVALDEALAAFLRAGLSPEEA